MDNYPNIKQDIRNILERADAGSVSAKGVRKELTEIYPGLESTLKSDKNLKKEIDEITVALFQENEDSSDEEAEEEDIKPSISSYKTPSSSSSAPTPSLKSLSFKKVPKISERVTHLETDEEYVQRLMREDREAGGGIGRTTRNEANGVAKKSVWKKKPKVVDADAAPRKPSNTGFNKPHRLSDALAAVCGSDVLSRPGVTKAIWNYIKSNGLQDPNQKNEIVCDEKLKKVLRGNRVNMMKIAKEIGSHLSPYTPDDE